MKRLRQWPKTLSAVLIWGTALTTLLIGLVTPLAASKWPVFPALGLGVFVAVARIFWKWRQGPYRDELHEWLASDFPGLYLLLLVAAVVGGAIGMVAPLLAYGQASDHPCLCLGNQRGRDWINLMVGGGGGALFLIPALSVAILAVYRLTHWRRPPVRAGSDDRIGRQDRMTGGEGTRAVNHRHSSWSIITFRVGPSCSWPCPKGCTHRPHDWAVVYTTKYDAIGEMTFYAPMGSTTCASGQTQTGACSHSTPSGGWSTCTTR